MGRNFVNTAIQVLIAVLIVLVVKKYPAESKWVLNQVLKRVDTVVQLDRFAPLAEKLEDVVAILPRGNKIPAIENAVSGVAEAIPQPRLQPSPTPRPMATSIPVTQLPYGQKLNYYSDPGLEIATGVKLSRYSLLINKVDTKALARWACILELCNGNTKTLIVTGDPEVGTQHGGSFRRPSDGSYITGSHAIFRNSAVENESILHEMAHASCWVLHGNACENGDFSESFASSISAIWAAYKSCGPSYQCYSDHIAREQQKLANEGRNWRHTQYSEYQQQRLLNAFLNAGEPFR